MAIVNVKQYDDYILQFWDVSVTDNWYNGSYIEINATDTTTGEFNTQLIIDAQGSGTYAASICNNATDGEKTDWYLPSIDELVALFDSGVTMSNIAWSSTEVDGVDVNVVDLDTGNVSLLDKSSTALIFKVRKEYISSYVTIERMNLQSIQADILRGGENNSDEDVYKMLGGVYGISKNSNILSNE
ncbi:hypothetical protein UFOVP603_9 [uncultured Caudovirales phage]|uniref:DUF1566 domain-containing protein n=1 Tax=uncultured Caudovirales phage TaxID=2100421 RepID=A0A6J5N123_9CAUD|nr:hypothetical protein UFOVP603_9 [uncultured Caudovirales phage]